MRRFLKLVRRNLNIMDAGLEKLLREVKATPIATTDVDRGIELAVCYVNGYSLMFMRCHNPCGERAYRLDDSLAKVLGFGDARRMRAVLPIQRSRRFLTVQSLRRAINRYGLRSMGLDELAKSQRKPKQTK